MSTTATRHTAIETTVARLDAWLESTRGSDGYGGPVAHWWQQSLVYTGVGRDWRYEGIIAGYLRLWERTGDERWLQKAQRAGDDLVRGQLADSHYAASAFEANPATAGTPHEAAADVGLLHLARALRQAGNPDSETYLAAAEQNLRGFYLNRLWDEATRSFRDDPHVASFVPNKAATACDALFLLADLTGDAAWVERYALPTLDRIVDHQIVGNGPLAGGIAQNSLGKRRVEKYFPMYIARCVPALLRGSTWIADGHYADAAVNALRFVFRWGHPDGSFPAVVYPNRQVSRYPTWIAPLGDVLRAATAARPFGFEADLSATRDFLLAGQDVSGGFQTARGFARLDGGDASAVPDARDVLHVAGWCDKAFRYLCGEVASALPGADTGTFETPCRLLDEKLQLVETADALHLWSGKREVYRWRKGSPWAEVAAPEFWLK